MVVGKGNNHDGTDLDLSVDGDGLLLDRVESQDGGLGEVDDGGSEEGSGGC